MTGLSHVNGVRCTSISLPHFLSLVRSKRLASNYYIAAPIPQSISKSGTCHLENRHSLDSYKLYSSPQCPRRATPTDVIDNHTESSSAIAIARDEEEEENMIAPPPYFDSPSFIVVQPSPIRIEISAARAAISVTRNRVDDNQDLLSRKNLPPYEPHTRESDLEAAIPSSRNPLKEDDNICSCERSGQGRCICACDTYCCVCYYRGVLMFLFALSIYCIWSK